VILYVLPALWTSSCFDMMQGSRVMRMFRPVRQVAAPGVKSAVFDYIL